MLKLILNSFKTTNDCIILVTPLIVFLSIFGWYYVYATDAINTVPKLCISCITMLIMLSIFLSAWLYSIKKTIAISRNIFVFDKDRNEALKNLFLILPTGISKLFLPILEVLSMYLLIFIILFYLINFVVENYIGIIHLNSYDFQTLLLPTGEIVEEFRLLSASDLNILYSWLLLTLIGTGFVSFFTIFWIPEILYNHKNTFLALKNSITHVIRNFKDSFLVFIIIFTTILSITILNTLVMSNPIVYFFVSLLYYYFLLFVIVLLFTYYEQAYNNEK